MPPLQDHDQDKIYSFVILINKETRDKAVNTKTVIVQTTPIINIISSCFSLYSILH